MNTKTKFCIAVIATCLCLIVILGGCSKSKNEVPDPGFAQVVNPLVTVDSAEDMEKHLGYSIPVLEKEVDTYIVLVIDGVADSGRIRYADGSDFNIKKGTGDISGIYGGVYEGEKTISGVVVSFFCYEDIHYAIWEKDGVAFSLTGATALEEDVAALINYEQN